MRWTFFVAVAAIAVTLWLPGEAARSAGQPAPVVASGDKITFEQYRDWRNKFIERRRRELTAELAAGTLPAERRARLEQVKVYYDRFAGLDAAERDRRYRARFDRIDTDHDGTMDAAERAAWRAQRAAFYRNSRPTAETSDVAAGPAAAK